MSTAEDITAAYAEAFDAKREVLLGEGATLVLVLDAGQQTEEELAVNGGWWPERQQRFGEVNSIYVIKVTERAELTAEVMGRADRLELNGVLYDFNHDPPVEAPREWTLYATERKATGMR